MSLTILPSIALDIILEQLKYNDVRVLLNTPLFRDMIMDHISYEPNLIQFKKKMILDCIHQFERDLGTNFFIENIDYFIKQGYVEIYKLPIFEQMLDNFYVELEEKCTTIPDSLKLVIQKCRKEKIDPVELSLKDFRNYEMSFDSMKNFIDTLNIVAHEYYEMLGVFEDEHINHFVEKFFGGRKGLQNLLLYLLELDKYISQYLKGCVDAMKFKDTLSKQLKNIVYLFEK